ncbi:hypothetical protein CJ010_19315 [Azoarcus sp. DD4]|uniref:DUF4124 domain-containing protein n=1 Tax=Azoarcus sp. DD4 TaxID=2027405 RepID=UPI00112D05EA|nr:DUF4124 domain-containing protein [Azoarcus sp. DD4]QDF98533.1 hypothetical protein CJ010_19315 [Azoarcus sp. DD4]
MRRIWIYGVLGLAWAVAAQAQTVYRWKDAGGQLNYGSQPPPGVNAEPIGGRGSVTVMPAPAAAATPAPADATAARLERLERELEEERRLRRDEEARREEEADRKAEARADCEREYREACDEEGRPLGSRYIAVPVPVPVRPYRPQQAYPHTRDDHRDDGRHRDYDRRDRREMRDAPSVTKGSVGVTPQAPSQQGSKPSVRAGRVSSEERPATR